MKPGHGAKCSQSKSENKLVFVDVYTKWCGPCKHKLKPYSHKKTRGILQCTFY
ncbi:MAG: thioredoxin family protein [Butyricimonas paravirosa]